MSAADAASVRRQSPAIATEAAFFGYDLSLPDWQYAQADCPASPSSIILQYRRTAQDGAQSVFSAVVPRGSGRVQVVPVLYRNATPFKSAVGSKRSLSVFNQAIPPGVARRELQAGGGWLQLALCYAEIAGAEARLPGDKDAHGAPPNAPAPTLQISEANRTTTAVFTDRSGTNAYMVWKVAFDGNGRVTAATATPLADDTTHNLNGKPAQERGLPAGVEPKVVPLPPATSPQTKPIPQ